MPACLSVLQHNVLEMGQKDLFNMLIVSALYMRRKEKEKRKRKHLPEDACDAFPDVLRHLRVPVL